MIAGTPNLAEENVLALLNFAASLLGPGESYVEVGSYYGASLIGAMRGNPGDFVAIDRFSFDVPEVRGPEAPTREPRRARGVASGGSARSARRSSRATRSSWSRAARSATARVGVWYYDGPHDYASQLRGLQMVEPWLATRRCSSSTTTTGTRSAAAPRSTSPASRAPSCSSRSPAEEGSQPWWWDGVAVLGWRRA